MPSCAIGAVIGTKGAKISEIMAESGTDIDVGRECITGMPDNPVVLKGQRSQIVRAAVLANDVLQDLADKGRVNADDFRYIPGRTPAPRLGSRGTFSSCAAARFLFDKEFAGFIIGKGGEKITRIRDQTGATLQFRGSAEEVALFLGPDDRILDIRGTATQRNQAVEFCFKEMESAPQPIPETRVFIPLAVPEAPLEETVARTGASCSLSQDVHITSPESSERIVRLEGAPSERLAATLGLLAKADEYATASAPSARPHVAAVAPRTDRPNGITASSVPSVIVPQSKTEDSSEQRIEPETGKAYTFAEFRVAFAATYSEQDICDYWRDACTPVQKREQGGGSAGPGHVDRVERAERVEPVQAPVNLSRQQPDGPGPQGSPDRKEGNKEADRSTIHPVAVSEQKASTDPAPSRNVPSSAAASLPQWRDHLVEIPPSQLHVVLPTALVKGPLVEQGFLAEIAVGCHVQIDVCGEIASGKLHVILSGSGAANAMAVVALQMRAWFAGGSL
ncbi:FUBP3 [Symbiodinium sp. CCMP2592]|nr:FUBP3 [Symbiodinium sp. CCMP2592]